MSKQPVRGVETTPVSRKTPSPTICSCNPDFFERHATLLTKLKLPHSRGAAAVSLVERQVLALRDKNQALETRLRELIEVARGNDVLAAKIHRLACRLIARAPRAGAARCAGSLAARGFRRIGVAAAAGARRRI